MADTVEKARNRVESHKSVDNIDIGDQSGLDGVGMNLEALGKRPRLRTSVENERDSVVIGKKAMGEHVAKEGERGERRKGTENGVAEGEGEEWFVQMG